MHTISIASIKGGVGKTTLSLLVAAEMALEGYKVALLDCDLNQHAVAFGEKSSIPNLTVIGAVDENNVLKHLQAAQKDHDLAIIDLPGVSSTLALKAFQRSDVVLIPSQVSLPDVRDAFRTNAQVDDAQELRGSPIARSLVWTRIPAGFESRAARHVRETVDGTDVPIMRSSLFDRAIFREIHITGRVPRQTDPTGNSAENVYAVTQEILALIPDAAEAIS